MRYSEVSSVLQEISLAPRSSKADIAAGLLTGVSKDPQKLCLAVRLLTGELWPPWDNRVMGVGPEIIASALAEVSDFDIISLRSSLLEMGLVAEKALEKKGQHPLVREPLEALSIYDSLRRISDLKGLESEQRKISILRGLFLAAMPIEGKFIARTALRGNQVGLGAKTMIAAISLALHCDEKTIRKAYGLMPDLGAIAEMALKGDLKDITIKPTVPARLMLFFRADPPVPGAYLPRYPGLRVQVHKKGKAVLIFTSQLRDLTIALNGLSRQIGEVNADFVIDADLIGFYDARKDGPGSSKTGICSQSEMQRYINRRRLSRKSSIRPAIVAFDLLALGDKDICSMPYQDRRSRLLEILGQPRDLPFFGISPATELVLTEKGSVEDFLGQAVKSGARSLLGRDLLGAYLPGEVSPTDVIIRVERHISFILLRVQWDRSRKVDMPEKYLVALRNREQLVPIGWFFQGLSRKIQQELSSVLMPMNNGNDDETDVSSLKIILNIRIRGALKSGGSFIILEPMIEQFKLHASFEDVDDLSLLESVCIS